MTNTDTQHSPSLRWLLWVSATIMVVSDFIGVVSFLPVGAIQLDTVQSYGLLAVTLGVSVLIATLSNLIHSHPSASQRAGFLGRLVALLITTVLTANTLVYLWDYSDKHDTYQTQTYDVATAEVRSNVTAQIEKEIKSRQLTIGMLLDRKALGWKGAHKTLTVSAATLDCGDPDKMDALSKKSRKYKNEWIAFNTATCTKIARLRDEIAMRQTTGYVDTQIASQMGGTIKEVRGVSLLDQWARALGPNATWIMAGTIAFLLVMLLRVLRKINFPPESTYRSMKQTAQFVTHEVVDLFSWMWGGVRSVSSWMASGARKRKAAQMTPLERAEYLFGDKWKNIGLVERACILELINVWVPGQAMDRLHDWFAMNVKLPGRKIYPAHKAKAIALAAGVGILVVTNPSVAKNNRRYAFGEFNLDE